MTVLLLGATGLAGTAVKNNLIERGVTLVGVARANSDIKCDLSDETQLIRLLHAKKYHAIINAAAQIDINRCETHPLESWKINAKLVSILTNYCLERNIPLLQISTDHYYTTGDGYPHKEQDPVILNNEYSRHKYAAEAYALASKNSLVIRTSILGFRPNRMDGLIPWAMSMLFQQKAIELFNDAWTSSIDVETFAEVALTLFMDLKYTGLINVGSRTVYTKERLIRSLADKLELDHSFCTTTSVKKKLNRSNCLGLDVTKVEKLLKRKMPTLAEVCDNLVHNLDCKQLKNY